MGNFRGKFYVKMIAAVVALVFLHQQIVWAQGGAAPAAMPPAVARASANVAIDRESADVGDIDLPYNLAHRDSAYTGSSEETIIHLQDAHASLSAQYSLVNLLDVLAKDYDLEFIALEGTEGVIDTSLLKSFPDKDIREKTADLLMREGRMSAGEFFQITRDEKNIMLCGVEDNELYKENLDGFCRVIEQREPLIKMVKAFKAQISVLEEKVYSEELRTFLYKGRAHKNGTLSFSDYWRDIRPFLEEFSIKTENLRDMPLLTQSIELERKIDFEKANSERTRLISDLTARLKKNELEALVLESVNFKEQKISPATFHKYLKRLAEKNSVSMSSYKNFSMFTEYISLYESVDIFNLYGEVESLEKTIREKLYRTDDERELNEISVMMEFLRGLYSVELSSRDFEFFKSHREKYDAKKFAAFLRDKCGAYNVSIEKGYDLGEMFGGINSAENFYKTAARRDRLMIQNTLKRMKSEKKRVAALITGGYHTKGLTKIMKENKLSYLIISPKFEKDEERPYVAVLTGKKKPYQELLESGKYQISVAAWNNPLDGIDTQSLKDQEIALLSGGIAGLYGSGKWKELVEDWKLDIDPNSGIYEVLGLLKVRRVGDTVLAGLDNRPLVALKKDKDGNPKRTKVSKKHRKIWEKRAGYNITDLTKITSDVMSITKVAMIEPDSNKIALLEKNTEWQKMDEVIHPALVISEKNIDDTISRMRTIVSGVGQDKNDEQKAITEEIHRVLKIKGIKETELGKKVVGEFVNAVMEELETKLTSVVEKPFVLTREIVEKICQRLLDEADSKPYEQNEKKLRENVKKAFLRVGVPKTFLESDAGKEQIQRVMDVLKKDDGSSKPIEENSIFEVSLGEKNWKKFKIDPITLIDLKKYLKKDDAIFEIPKSLIFERTEVGLVAELKKEDKLAIVDNSIVDVIKKFKNIEPDKFSSKSEKLITDKFTKTYEDSIESKNIKKWFLARIKGAFKIAWLFLAILFTELKMLRLRNLINKEKDKPKVAGIEIVQKDSATKSILAKIRKILKNKFSFFKKYKNLILGAITLGALWSTIVKAEPFGFVRTLERVPAKPLFAASTFGQTELVMVIGAIILSVGFSLFFGRDKKNVERRLPLTDTLANVHKLLVSANGMISGLLTGWYVYLTVAQYMADNGFTKGVFLAVATVFLMFSVRAFIKDKSLAEAAKRKKIGSDPGYGYISMKTKTGVDGVLVAEVLTRKKALLIWGENRAKNVFNKVKARKNLILTLVMSFIVGVVSIARADGGGIGDSVLPGIALISTVVALVILKINLDKAKKNRAAEDLELSKDVDTKIPAIITSKDYAVISIVTMALTGLIAYFYKPLWDICLNLPTKYEWGAIVVGPGLLAGGTVVLTAIWSTCITLCAVISMGSKKAGSVIKNIFSTIKTYLGRIFGMAAIFVISWSTIAGAAEPGRLGTVVQGLTFLDAEVIAVLLFASIFVAISFFDDIYEMRKIGERSELSSSLVKNSMQVLLKRWKILSWPQAGMAMVSMGLMISHNLKGFELGTVSFCGAMLFSATIFALLREGIDQIEKKINELEGVSEKKDKASGSRQYGGALFGLFIAAEILYVSFIQGMFLTGMIMLLSFSALGFLLKVGYHKIRKIMSKSEDSVGDLSGQQEDVREKVSEGKDKKKSPSLTLMTLMLFMVFMFGYRLPAVHGLDADAVKTATSQLQKVPRQTIELDPSKLEISGNRLFMEWTGDLTGGYAFEVEFEEGYVGPKVQMGIDGGKEFGYVYSYPKVPTREGLLRFDLASGNDRQNGGACEPTHVRNVGFAIWDGSSSQEVKSKIKSIRFVSSKGSRISRKNNGQTIETGHQSISNIEWEQNNSSWAISLDVNERETKEAARFGSVYINFNAAEYAKNNPGKPIKVGLYLNEKFTGTQGGGGNGIWVGFVRRDENGEYKKIYEIEGQGGYTGKVYANNWTEYSLNLPKQELENVLIRVDVGPVRGKAFNVRVGSASEKNISTSEESTGKKDLEKPESRKEKLKIWEWIKRWFPSKSKLLIWAPVIALTSFIAGSGIFNAALGMAGEMETFTVVPSIVTPVMLIVAAGVIIGTGIWQIRLLYKAFEDESKAKYFKMSTLVSIGASIVIAVTFGGRKILTESLGRLAGQNWLGMVSVMTFPMVIVVISGILLVSATLNMKIIGEKLFKKKEHYDLARSAFSAVLITNGTLILRNNWDSAAVAVVKKSLMYECIGSWAFVGIYIVMAIFVMCALLSIGETIFRLWKLSIGKKHGDLVRWALGSVTTGSLFYAGMYFLPLIERGLSSDAFRIVVHFVTVGAISVCFAFLGACAIGCAIMFVCKFLQAIWNSFIPGIKAQEKTGEGLTEKEQDSNDGKSSWVKRGVKRFKRLGVFVFIKKHSKLFPLMLVTAISFFAGLGVFNAAIVGTTETMGRINVFSAVKDVELIVIVRAIPKEVLVLVFVAIMVSLISMRLFNTAVQAIRLARMRKNRDVNEGKIKDIEKKQREMNKQVVSSMAWVGGSFFAIYNLAWIIGIASVIIPFCVLGLSAYAGYSVLKFVCKFVQTVRSSSLSRKMNTKTPEERRKKKRSIAIFFTVIMFVINTMFCWIPGVAANDEKPESLPAVKTIEPRHDAGLEEGRIKDITPRTDVGIGEEIIPLTRWHAETYDDSQGIVDVYEYNGILKIVADMHGQSDNKSMGEVYRNFDAAKDFTGKKKSFKIRAPEKYALNQENGVAPYMMDVNGNKQYADRTKITQSGEWTTIEMVPMPYGRARRKENSGRFKCTDPGFDPSLGITRVGIKFVIDEKSRDTFISENPDKTVRDGYIEVADMRIMPVEGVVHEAEWQNVYRDVPIVVPAVSAETFVANSGVSFYLKMYERAIGTPDGVTAHYVETLNEFKKLAERGVKKARILLCMGSKDTSGIEFDEDTDMPIGFKDQDLAILDIANLIRIGAETDIELTLVPHNKDITEAHPGVFGDEEKWAALVALDKIAFNGAKEMLEEDVWEYFEYGEMLNEPDDAGVHSYYTQEFVKTGNAMLRDDIGKPVSLGPAKIEHIGNWLLSSQLKAGDMYQIHAYNDNLEELLVALRKNIGEFKWPEGVKICFGEAQISMYDTESRTTNSILYEVFLAAHQSGADRVYGWYDNRFAPQYTFDADEYQSTIEYMMSAEYDTDGDDGQVVDDDETDVADDDVTDETNEDAVEPDDSTDVPGESNLNTSEGVCYIQTIGFKEKPAFQKNMKRINTPIAEVLEREGVGETVFEKTGNWLRNVINSVKEHLNLVVMITFGSVLLSGIAHAGVPSDFGEVAKQSFALSAFGKLELAIVVFSIIVAGAIVALALCRINTIETVAFQEKPVVKKIRMVNNVLLGVNIGMGIMKAVRVGGFTAGVALFATSTTLLFISLWMLKEKFVDDPALIQKWTNQAYRMRNIAKKPIHVKTPLSVQFWKVFYAVKEWISSIMSHFWVFVVTLFSVALSAAIANAQPYADLILKKDIVAIEFLIAFVGAAALLAMMFVGGIIIRICVEKYENRIEEAEFKVVLGLPETVYSKIENTTWEDSLLDATYGAELILLTGCSDREAIQEEFNREIKGKKVIGAIIDLSALEVISGIDEDNNFEYKDFDKLVKVIKDFVETAKKEIAPLMAPKPGFFKLKGLTRGEIKKDFDKLNKLTKEKTKEWNGKIDVLVRTFPAESLELMDKGAYHVPVNKWHRAVVGKTRISSKAKELALYGGGKFVGHNKYISVSAYNLADMRFIANAIKDLGIDENEASKFIHVRLRNNNVRTEADLKKYIKKTGLDGYLDIGNVDIISEQEEKEMTLEKIIAKIKAGFPDNVGKISNRQIFVGSTKELNLSDKDKQILSMNENAPKFVQMKGEGIVSQLLLTLVEFSAAKKIPASLGKITLDPNDTGLKIYIYVPKIKKADYNAILDVIKNYEKMMMSV